MVENNSTLEQAETLATSTKKAPEGANFNYGGVDVARFELFVNRFIKHLFAPNIAKICSMIEKLEFVA